MRKLTSQHGFTLVELMIGMALGVAALTALGSLVGYGVGVNVNLLKSARVNEESSMVLSLLQRDIRRAGYSGDTVAMLTDPTTNPSDFSDSLVISAYTGEAAGSCILFSYDANDNGVLDTTGNSENFGYRLRGQTVEMRQSNLSCTQDGWLPLTDSDIVQIQGLSFTMGQTLSNNIPTTSITINLQAELAANTDISRQFTTEVLVRNYDG